MQVLRELRIKGSLMDHKEIRAAMGVKIVAPGLETAVAGTSLFVVQPEVRACVRVCMRTAPVCVGPAAADRGCCTATGASDATCSLPPLHHLPTFPHTHTHSLPLAPCPPQDDEEELKDAVMEDMADIFSKVDKGGEGVCVQVRAGRQGGQGGQVRGGRCCVPG